MTIATRHRLAVDALALDGSEHVLEIGCGLGVATRLVLDKLKTGQVTALDRSRKMIAVVKEQSSHALKAGRLLTRAEALESADFEGRQFDAIVAINVDLNLRLGERWAPLLRALMKKGGRIVLAFEAPKGSAKGETFAHLSQQRLQQVGLEVTSLVNEDGVYVLIAR